MTTSGDLAALETELAERIAAASDEAALEAARVAALGKKGTISELLKGLGGMSPAERQVMGPALNGLKDRVGAAILARRSLLKDEELVRRLAEERVDVTLPVRPSPLESGRIHPVSQVIDEITALFADLGFSVAEGPDIETDYYNFTALNFPVGHPAREMHDTFFFNPKPDGERMLLRTHTSPVQIRTMETQKPPIRVIIPGRTYRQDFDQTHTPMFHQVEGLVIDEESHVGHMRWVLEEFCKAFFEVEKVEMRFRPSFFPFTEPSMEVDIRCKRIGNEIRFGEGDDWLEILGCGMVHPNVIRNCGLDPDKVQGFAWGMGIDRIAMLKYGMPDLRAFFDADIRWLDHYGFRPLDIPTLLGGAQLVKFTLSWLKEHLDTAASVDAIAEKLTMVGLEVESVHNPARELGAFTIARVVSAEQHPNADRLRVCMVDTGDGGAPVQVVCGAPNARTGMKSVFSPPGTFIPGKNITLSVGTIRGVESRGMLCSPAELKISDDHEGIIELPDEAPVGRAYAAWAGLDDPVIDVAVTANRGDALGVAGIARDLAAAGIGTLKTPAIAPVKGGGPCPVKVALDFGAAPSLCPAFGLRLVRGVKNGPSPEWLQKRLRAIGLRPINALVDITNFLTYDRDRPLHVFDAAKVKGGLTVRRARSGETVVALDGKTYTLDESMCVIADEHGVESIAGIMGGEASGCSETTTDVLIESALWEPLNIAQTGRKFGIQSDARHRFERGVDPAFMIPGLELATQLVLDLCGGTPTEILVAGEVPEPLVVIDFPVAEVKRLAGIDPAMSEATDILAKLGFDCKPHRTKGGVTVTVPTWRPDVTMKADLVEEVVRIIGVDKIPVVAMRRSESVARPILTPIQARTRRAKRALAARGMVEAVTWSFIARKTAEAFGGGAPELALANPIAADMSDMRPSLLPGLIAAAQRNADRGFADLSLFEVGQVYRGDRPDEQSTAAAGIRRGLSSVNGAGRHWSAKSAPASAFDAKADALALLDTLGLSPDKVQVAAGGPAWFHPGRSATIRQGPKVTIGTFGEFHPKVLELLDASGPLGGFEIILDAIPLPKARATRTKPPLFLSDLQPVKRDFSFLLDRHVEAAKVIRAAEGSDRRLIADVSVFDLFEGDSLGPGKKSLAIEVTLQPTTQTLTDEEIDAIGRKIVAEVVKATGGALRA